MCLRHITNCKSTQFVKFQIDLSHLSDRLLFIFSNRMLFVQYGKFDILHYLNNDIEFSCGWLSETDIM